MRFEANRAACVAVVRGRDFLPHPLPALGTLIMSAALVLCPTISAAQSSASGAASSAPPIAAPSEPQRGARLVKPVSQGKPPAAVSATVAQELRWRDLTPLQQVSLKSLEQDWAGMDVPRRQKWVQVADRLPRMLPAEQARVQARMVDWAKLTPQQRGQTRLNFQEAKQLPRQDRQARWDAYQSLSQEQKRELAARAVPSSVASSASIRKPAATGRDISQVKSNIVPNPVFANRPNAISPTVVRASPGATTTIISKPPTPPSHQQTGMPKIAATPAFVDKATLLPLRGPQGAAIHPDAASGARSPSSP